MKNIKFRVLAKATEKGGQYVMGEFNTKAEAQTFIQANRAPKSAIVRNGFEYIISPRT